MRLPILRQPLSFHTGPIPAGSMQDSIQNFNNAFTKFNSRKYESME